jgi:hypothetical protein
MTHQNSLELAKQGNSKAIAFLINRSLQSKGVTAQTSLKDNCLQVLLEAVEIPNQQTLAPYVLKGVTGLGAASIKKLRVYGRKQGEAKPSWSQEFELLKQDGAQTDLPEQLTPVSGATIKAEDAGEKGAATPDAKPPANTWVSCLTSLILLGLTAGSIYVIGAGSAYLFGSLFGSEQSNKSVSNTPSTDASPYAGQSQQEAIDDLALKVATWNVELVVYKTMIREVKGNPNSQYWERGVTWTKCRGYKQCTC